MQRGFYIIIFLFSFFEFGNSFAQDSEPVLSQKGLKLFETENYIAATPIYLQLVALQPRNSDYNYKYGACLLFNATDKKAAIKYLEFATMDPAINPDAYYFLGKAFHLNYQFDKAISSYQEYKVKSKKIEKKWEIDRQIQSCNNGKNLLKNFSELIVVEKKSVLETSFYSAYDLSAIGGDFVISDADQSKLDKKKGHRPLIYFPPNVERVFFGSYGETESRGKDIYVKQKQADGSWSKPVLVQGEVNSDFDEDFPYMDVKNAYLYFSSKGHNSMGGYDIFRAKYNAANNSFYKPENLDFSISSTADDLLYLKTDSDQFAWFASSRQSVDGKIDVYKIEITRPLAPIAVVQGIFNSTINPTNKKVTIDLIDSKSKKVIGTYYTDEKGKYLISFPKSGRYEFSIKVFGTAKPFTEYIDIASSEDLIVMKQKMTHLDIASKESIELIQVFDKEADSKESILADYIVAQSNLKPNAEDLKRQLNNQSTSSDNSSKNNNSSAFEALSKAQELSATYKEERSKNEDYLQKSFQLITENNQNILALQLEVKNDIAKTHGKIDAKEKAALLFQANEKINQISELETNTNTILVFTDSIQKSLVSLNVSAAQLTDLENQLKKAELKNDEAIFKVLSDNKSLIETIESQGKEMQKDVIRTEIVSLTQAQTKNKEIIKSYESNSKNLKEEIKSLETKKSVSKGKKVQEYQIEIDAKNNELELIENEIRKNEAKLGLVNEQLLVKNEELNYIQKLQKQPKPAKNKTYENVGREIKATDNQNFRTLKSYVEQEISNQPRVDVLVSSKEEPQEQIQAVSASETLVQEENYGSKNENNQTVSDLTATHKTEVAKIESNTKMTSQQKGEAILKTENDLKKKLENSIVAAEATLSKKPADETAIKELESLVSEKEQVENRISEQSQTLLAKEVERNDADKVLSQLDPNYKKDVLKIEKSKSESKSTELIQRENQLQSKLKEKLEINEKLNTDGTNISLLAQSQVINSLIEASESKVEAMQTESKGNDSSAENLTVENEIEAKEQNSSSSEYVPQNQAFRTSVMDGNANLLRGEFTTESELLKQREAILNYQDVLENRAKELTSQMKTNASGGLKSDLKWTNDELDEVEVKLSSINAKLSIIKEEQAKKEALLASESKVVSSDVKQEKSEKKNELAAKINSVEEASQRNNELIAALTSKSSEKNKILLNNLALTNEKISNQLNEISTTTDLELKSKMLVKLEQEQLIVQENIAELVREQYYDDLVLSPQNKESLKVNALVTNSTLESKKRKYLIEIGDLSNSVKELDLQIAALKKEKAGEIIADRDQKQQLLQLKQLALVDVESELKERKDKIPAIFNEKDVLNQAVSEEQENRAASSKEYKIVYSEHKEIVEFNKQIQKLETELEGKRKEIELAFSQSKSTEKSKTQFFVENKLAEINSLNSAIDKIVIQRNAFQEKLQKSLTETASANVIQNLLVRDIDVIESTGNKTNTAKNVSKVAPTQQNSKNKVESGIVSSGISYRIQVGAFSKAIDESIFKDYFPVSKDVLDNGITRYTVGDFANKKEVFTALDKIKKNGYGNAFAVVYCNGTRISMQEAKQLEENGGCVSSVENKDYVKKLIDKIEQTEAPVNNTEVKSKSLKTLVPIKTSNVAAAQNVESRLGLFYTVQVGVYNKYVPASQLYNIEPLITQRLENGQIRYSTGVFHSVANALPKRDEAVVLGIKDAYVTAYFEGKRISLQEARVLLAQKGQSILEPIKVLENKVLSEDQLIVVETKMIEKEELKIEKMKDNLESSELNIQLVSKKQYENFPLDVIKRYNQKGDFYYDAKDKRVKSMIYTAVNLPSVYGFKDDIDTVIIRTKTRQEVAKELILKVELKETTLPGDIGDWLLRFGYLRELKVLDNRIQLTVFGITDPIDYDFLMTDLRSLGFDPVSEN